MKLDRDGSGSIDKDEFLQIPAIASNPLALRMIAIFDEEYVFRSFWEVPTCSSRSDVPVALVLLIFKNLLRDSAHLVIREAERKSFDVS